MPSGMRLRLTVPAKCGSTRLTQLMMIVTTGRMPQPPHGFHTKEWLINHRFDPRRLLPCQHDLHVLAARTMWLLVVRNPYERLLSCFLDKVARPHRPDFQVRYRPSGRNVRPNRTADGFADFVEWYGRRPGWHNASYRHDMNAMAKLHLWPIVHTPNVHVQDALWSMRSKRYAEAYGRASIIKLEHTSSWLPSVTNILGIKHAVVNRQWQGGCFFKAHGETCEDALKERSAAGAARAAAAGTTGSGAGFARVPWRATAGRAGARPPTRVCEDMVEQQDGDKPPESQHNTSACALLHAFYSPRTARIVTELMADDLKAFGYPSWTAAGGVWPW